MKTTLLGLTALALLAACAQGPASIAPTPMGNAFATVDCGQASAMLVAEQSNLDALSASQRGAVTGDAIGVFLIGVPVSSLTGNDKSGEIASSKGKVLALQTRLASC